MKNYPIKIETGEHAGETVWVHRSIAVAGFIFCRINNEWCVLANQRGEGAPDFQGYWNCPCGYLDFDETLAEACSREIYEETGVKIESKWDSGTAENILRRHTMKYLNPSFYGQQ